MTPPPSGLVQLLALVRSGWRTILLVVLSVGVGATVYVETRPEQYDASAIVSVSPRPDAANPELVRLGTARYVSFITAPVTIRRVAAQLGEDPVELRRRVKATVATDTGDITVTVRQPDPARAVRTANGLARHLREFSRGDRLLMAEIIAPADRPTEPAGPSRRLVEASALLVGLVLGLGLAALVASAGAARPAPQPAAARRSGPPARASHPVVGRLPWSPELRSAAGALADPTLVEAGLALLDNLSRELGREGQALLVVVSPPGRHGRSVTARLVAGLLARAGRPVLLVGARRDHPELYRRPAGAGALPLARGQEPRPVRAWIRDLWMVEEGLWVLPAWQDLGGGTLAAGGMAQVLEQARDLFDTVVVDSPALVSEDVARALTWLADGVLLVVAQTGAEPAPEPVETLLHGFSVPFVGMVLNQVKQVTGATEPEPAAAQRLAPPEA